MDKLKKIKDAKIFTVFKKKETASTKTMIDVTEHANVIEIYIHLLNFFR